MLYILELVITCDSFKSLHKEKSIINICGLMDTPLLIFFANSFQPLLIFSQTAVPCPTVLCCRWPMLLCCAMLIHLTQVWIHLLSRLFVKIAVLFGLGQQNWVQASRLGSNNTS